MTLQDYITRLSYGLLSSTSYVDSVTGSIETTKLPRVIHAINEALLKVHSKFVLHSGSVIVEMQEGRTQYPLQVGYSYQNHNPALITYPYIMDLGNNAFTGRVLKVLQVFDNNGCERSLNNSDDPWSLFTPRPDVLENPRPKKYEAFSLSYQQNHPEVEELTDVINVPDIVIGAMDSYVNYLLFGTIGTQEAKAASTEQLLIYERMCEEIDQYDLVNSSQSSWGKKFRQNGWV